MFADYTEFTFCSLTTFNTKMFKTNYQKRSNDQRTHDKSRNSQFIFFWFRELIVLVYDDTKNEIIKLFSINWTLNLFERTTLTTIYQLLTSNKNFEEIIFINLMNIDCIAYTVIDEELINIIYEQLQIVFISLFVFRSLRDYNKQIVFKSIIYVIYLIFKINRYAK